MGFLLYQEVRSMFYRTKVEIDVLCNWTSYITYNYILTTHIVIHMSTHFMRLKKRFSESWQLLVLGKCSAESESWFTHNSSSHERWRNRWRWTRYFQSVESQFVPVAREIWCKNISLQGERQAEKYSQNRALTSFDRVKNLGVVKSFLDSLHRLF